SAFSPDPVIPRCVKIAAKFDNFVRAVFSSKKERTMRSILWTPILILFASVFCSAQSTLYIPQVANGFDPGSVAWITAVVVTNTAAAGTALASGTITFTKDNGTAWSLLMNDDQGNLIGNASLFPFQIAGGQTRAFVTTGTDSAVLTGFATVTSNVPV